MVVKQVVVVGVIRLFKNMKKYILGVFLICSILSFSQEEKEDTTDYKKRVLESAEVDFLMSYYQQDGTHAAVTGGIGDEYLTDLTPTIIVSLPLNDDDVLTVDVGISAYTSASSSNLDPFDSSGASQGGGDDDDDNGGVSPGTKGSPWVESSGASQGDVWGSVNVNYAHSSDDRNDIWSANVGFATEYDYTSIGFGGGYTKLFNEKNTEIGMKAQVYLDSWSPRYPTEIDSYIEAGSNINNGFFQNVDILNQAGTAIDKTGTDLWSPINTTLVDDKSRNSYSVSISFSQIINKNSQFSLFFDVVQQKGWLSNPMQRVYFADRPNYYIGEASGIPVYDTSANQSVFQLADDIERLPDTRFKIPIGMRYNHYINETISLRTYYRYYYDDWGINSHTASIELPIKIGDKFTVYPTYRYYQQTAADYFAPYEGNLSTQEFYTSDYDLSDVDSHQYGLGIKYTDIFSSTRVFNFGIKSVDLRYSKYDRSDGLDAGIVSFGIKFVN
jgi:hypothetical protein